jgi:hypothetical protein
MKIEIISTDNIIKDLINKDNNKIILSEIESLRIKSNKGLISCEYFLNKFDILRAKLV